MRNRLFYCRSMIIVLSLVFLQGCCLRLSQDSRMPCGATEHEFTLFQDMSEILPMLDQQEPLALAESVQDGEVLFTGLCSGCHVYTRTSAWALNILKAQGSDATMPPELTRERFQQNVSEAYLKATIKYGSRKPFSAHSMPAWKDVLNDEDIRNLIAYIIHIGAPAPAPAPALTP